MHILTRTNKVSKVSGLYYFHWDVKEREINKKALEGVQYVIHLAGAGIARRWTKSYKKTIIDSRVDTANFLFDVLNNENQKLETFIGTSASNFYQPNTDKVLTEMNPSGDNFLAEVCKKWEHASQQFQQISKQVVIHRVGFVLSKNHGALGKMVPPFRFRLAPYFGNGNQYYPCVHIKDVASQFVFSLEKELDGVFNVYAENLMQKDLNRKIADAMNLKALQVSVPKPILTIALGEMSHILTDSLQLSNEKIQSRGFQPEFPDVESALQSILQN